MRVPAVKTVETEAALSFAKRLAGTMPPIRLTDLVADVDRLTGFSSLFDHLQTGRPPADRKVFYAALIAEATNLGFTKMAQACPGVTRRQLQQVAIWHFREDTFALALDRLVTAQHDAPFAEMFGSQNVSSSHGQHIHLGDAGENAGGPAATAAARSLSSIPTSPAATRRSIPRSLPRPRVRQPMCSMPSWRPKPALKSFGTMLMAAASTTSSSPCVMCLA